MTRDHHTRRFARTEEALIVLFCEVDDAYRLLNPNGDRYGTLKRLSDSEVITLALFQQLRATESQRSFSHLFPGVVGLSPSSFHRRSRKLRRYLEPLKRAVLPESWWVSRRPSSSTRRCFRCCIRAKSRSRRVSRGLLG